MKQIFSVIVLWLIFLFTVAQESEDVKIVFDKKIYDFGEIDRRSKAECLFTFINKSQTSVAILRVKSSCGCTLPVWSKEPVKPDDSGTIKLRYNTNITGKFNKTVTLYTTADKKPIVLTIKGEVVKKKESEND